MTRKARRLPRPPPSSNIVVTDTGTVQANSGTRALARTMPMISQRWWVMTNTVRGAPFTKNIW